MGSQRRSFIKPKTHLDFESARMGRDAREPRIVPPNISICGGGEANAEVADASPEALERGRRIAEQQARQRRR